MAPKSKSDTTPKGNFVCSECMQEFQGKSCPECGNTKGNLKLSEDGIIQEMHKPSVLFGTDANLLPTDEALDDDILLARKAARMEQEEIADNLRQSVRIKSELKRLELEKQIAQKKQELEAVKTMHDTAANYSQKDRQPVQDANIPSMGHNPLNPQAIFMTQLMRMDEKKREEFLNQLGEADPAALTHLSMMFGGMQAPAGMPQMPGMNPMMNPYMMNPYMNPYMMQPQHQDQGEGQISPMEIALAMVNQMMEMGDRMRPQPDNSAKEYIQELKQELKETNDRLTQAMTRDQESSLKPLLDRLAGLESAIVNNQSRGGVKESITEVGELLSSLETLGLFQRGGHTGLSVDEQINLMRAQHDIDKDNKSMTLEEQKIEAEKNKADINKQIMSAVFQRGLSKNMTHADQPPTTQRNITTRGNITNTKRSSAPPIARPPVPKVIVDEVQAEAGVIRETAEPVKKPEKE